MAALNIGSFHHGAARLTLQEVVKVRLRVVQIQLIVVHHHPVQIVLIDLTLVLTILIASTFGFILPLRCAALLKGVVAVEVLNPIIVSIRVSDLVFNLIAIFLCRRLLAHLRRLQLLTGLVWHGRGQLRRFFHLLFELFKVLLTLQLAFFFALLGPFNVDSEFVAQIVRELKFLVLNVRVYLRVLLQLFLLHQFLQIAEEKQALTKLNMLIECLGQAIADLF